MPLLYYLEREKRLEHLKSSFDKVPHNKKEATLSE